MNNTIAVPTSKVSRNFFLFSGIVLALQFLFGLAAAAQFVWPTFLANVLPFNATRMLHINALVVTLLAGFMGATYFLIAEEGGGKLASEKSAMWNFWLLAIGVAVIIAGYLYMALGKHYSLWWSEGREYIEAPRWADWAIVAVFLMFLFNVLRSVQLRTGSNPITRMLLLGLALLAVFYLFGMKFMPNLAVDIYFWWWVIHLWVEGAWELIAAALYALLLIRLYDFPRDRAAKYVYIEAGLVLFTGILGTGHHYYWIGTPGYWLWIGGIFSVLEPLPLLIMVFDALRIQRERREFQHPNQLVKLWLVGSVILHFVGAGVWGFAQTLPQVNRWTHGTQFTAAHGHISFYGAYTMLAIAMIYYALPRLRFGSDRYDQRRGVWAFWLMTVGMVMMTLSLTGAALVQIYMEKIAGLPFMDVQAYLGLFYAIRFWSGVAMIVGLLLFLTDLFALRPLLRTTTAAERTIRINPIVQGSA
jgi:nitric oxide reductase subunit B